MEFKVIVKDSSDGLFIDESVGFMESKKAIAFINGYVALQKSAQQSVQLTAFGVILLAFCTGFSICCFAFVR